MLHSLNVIGAGLFAFLGAALILAGFAAWTRGARDPCLDARDAAAVFLFEGQKLVDATPAARRLLRARPRAEADLADLLRLLARGFGPDLSERLAALPPGGRLSLASSGGAGTLEAAEEGGALRLTLRPDDPDGSAIDRLSHDAAQEELRLLRGLAEDAPNPIWTQDGSGALIWANRAYFALADFASSASPSVAERAAWPAVSLFPEPPALPDGQLHQERHPLAPPGGEEPLWYDVTTLRRGEGSLHFATDVTGLVQAEAARLQFVQTLAKTFAHLRTGLAIFDRERRLVLFNPAFLDLTGLPIDFLSGRPLLQAVLDRLRDAKVLPEPRDYASWRESVVALEAAAAQGDYRETWSLPNGQTWRVTGRPHPEGMLAFLFEDISNEVGLTRRFRAELETLRDVLDTMDEAVAVFSATGALHVSNAAYAGLWGSPGPDLAAETARWEAGCRPSPFWAEFREGPSMDPAGSGADLRRLDGRPLALRLSALPQGATLVAFRLASPEIRPRDCPARPGEATPATELAAV